MNSIPVVRAGTRVSRHGLRCLPSGARRTYHDSTTHNSEQPGPISRGHEGTRAAGHSKRIKTSRKYAPEFAHARYAQTSLPVRRANASTKPSDAGRGGELTHLDPIFIRDCCSCPVCLDPSSGQKNVWTIDIPADIRVKTRTEVEDGVTDFTWENDVPGMSEDHVTRIVHADLMARLYPVTPSGLHKPIIWNKAQIEDKLLKIDYQDYAGSEDGFKKALRSLRAHGLVLVTNVPESEESVVNIAERIGPLRNSFYGMTWDVRSVPNAENVAYTSQHLGFHMDLLYMNHPPKLQFLHCLGSSASGGASLFTDAYNALAQLHERDPRLLFGLRNTSTSFGYRKGNNWYGSRKPFVETQGIDPSELQHVDDITPYLKRVHWSPPFQVPAEARSVIGSENGLSTWHWRSRIFRDEVEKPENVFEHLLKPGECFIFDNLRVLHARTAFDVGDAGKERWLKGCYVDSDPYESKLRQLGN